MTSVSRFELTRTENDEKSASFYFFITNKDERISDQISSVYRCFKNNTYIQFKIRFSKGSLDYYIKSMVLSNEIFYTLNVKIYWKTADMSNPDDKTIISGGDWNHLRTDNLNSYARIVKITVTILNETVNQDFVKMRQQLHEDEDLTDIELRGDGDETEAGAATGVRVHRNVLATASEVLKRMVTGEWREAKEGIVLLPASTDTLRHFKDYIYLGKLPHDVLACSRLHSLANYFMMSELAEACLYILAADFQPEVMWNSLKNSILTEDFDHLEILMRNLSAEDVVQMKKYFKNKDNKKVGNGSKDNEE